MRLLPRVLPSIQCAKASYAQLPAISLRSATQALRLIASIPLIQRREKCPSREEKSAFTQWFSSVYVRSLKDQARKSKYPRTQILEPRTQSKLICHSSTTFIPTRSNNLIEVTSQSYIASHRKLYRNPSKAIQESVQSYIAFFTILYSSTHAPICLHMDHCTSCEEMALRNGLNIALSAKSYCFTRRPLQKQPPVIGGAL